MRRKIWYKFDFELNTKLANILGQNAKLARAKELVDEILCNGRVPHSFTFSVLIMAYIQDGKIQSIDESWKVYNLMIQLGGGNPSRSLQNSLFKSLASNERWLEQVDFLFESMKAADHDIQSEMYTSLIKLHGRVGNQDRIDALVEEMKDRGYALNLDIMNAVLDTCKKDGNECRAEETFRSLVKVGIKPDWRTYVSLIYTYGKAGMHSKSLQTFYQMEKSGINLNFSAYHAIIKVMASALQQDCVEKLLEQAENGGCEPLQPCYNAAMDMYLRLKEYKYVESIYGRMKEANVRPNHVTYNIVIDSYIKSGELESAEFLFKEIDRKGAIGANSQTYNIMLGGYGRACLRDKAFDIYQKMTDRGFQVDPSVEHHVRGISDVFNEFPLEKKMVSLSDDQREVIAGLLLGGVHTETADGGQTFELHFKFTSYNRTAIVLKEHLHQLFFEWLKPEYQLKGSRIAHRFSHFETISSGAFRFYALQYRPRGKPVIPKLIHHWLKPQTLAYWYMYGGCKCERTGGIMLNAAGYSQTEIQLVVQVLKQWTIHCTISKWRNGCAFWFEGESAICLWRKMKPYILEDVKGELGSRDISSGLENSSSVVSEIGDNCHVNSNLIVASPMHMECCIGMR
eukprot:c28489_g1_i1 orf=1288-3165(+)